MYFTINLLPPRKKEALRSGLVAASMETLLVFFLLLATIYAVTLVSLRFVLAGVEQDLADRSAQLTLETESPEREIREIDSYLKRLDVTQRSFIEWSTLLADIAAATPPGTVLTSLQVTPKGKVIIQGIASTRDDVLRFQEGLTGIDVLTDLSAPLSNILQRTDVAFTFEAVFAPLAALQPEQP